MKFALDVAYVDETGEVLKMMRMKRHHVGMPMWRSRFVVEAQAGAFERWGLSVGDIVVVREDDDAS